jgi:PqqA peptide cyclase
MLIGPDGTALPCHAANVIPGLQFENVKEKCLLDIWQTSSAFRKFRGEDWMQEPCKSCERRHQDFAGCRCQAFLFTSDPAATDPVCSLAPTRSRVDAILADIRSRVSSCAEEKTEWVYRPNPE